MITGQIRNIQPTADGGYSSQNGWIHTYDMTIDVPGGQPITGEIGSKSSPYPLCAGAEISVEVKNTEHGVRLKKVNPQYNQGGGQQGPPQGGGGTNSSQPNDGIQERIQWAQAVNLGFLMLANDKIGEMSLESTVRKAHGVIKDKNFPFEWRDTDGQQH